MMSEALKMFAKLFLVITVIFTVFLYLLAIVLGPALFYFTPEGLSTSILRLSALPVWFFNQTIFVPIGLSIGILFFVLWSTFTLCFVAAWKFRENFHKVIKESTVRPIGKLFNSCLFAMPILNSMTLLAVISLQSLQEAGGIPTGTSPLPGEPFWDFLDLSYAAVVEEVVFRIIPIGAFLLIYLLIIKKNTTQFSVKLLFVSFLFPDSAKRIVGAKTVNEHGIKRGISIGEWGTLILTSVIFGLAHFNPGVSWEIGKITSATIAGLAIGLSYLLYGAQASIIMHWFFNAYTNTFSLLSELYPTLASFATAVTLFSLILGILGWLTITTLGTLKLTRAIKERGKNRQDQTTTSPPKSLELDR